MLFPAVPQLVGRLRVSLCVRVRAACGKVGDSVVSRARYFTL